MSFRTAPFFDHVRAGILGPALSPGEVSGCEAILAAMRGTPIAWAAYALATAWHETASTMQPIREYGGAAYFRRRYDVAGANPRLAMLLGNTQPGDGVRFAGRGFVQLTGRANYARAGAALKRDLIDDPDLALQPDIAAAIMRRGMAEGWFTGRRLADCLPGEGPARRPAFVAARRIINGTDRAALIAGYALEFQHALQKGNWS
jgi:putative chitinase